MFKKLFETPFRTGTRDKNDFSGEIDWESYRNNINMVTDNFTAKKYKVYKSEIRYFITDKKDNYLLGIQFSEIKIKGKISIEIETVHSKEKGLYSKFIEYLASEYGYVISHNKQSTQAEKSWKKIVDLSNKVYKVLGNEIIEIKKSEIKDLYSTSWKIAISENNNGYSVMKPYFDKEMLSVGKFRDEVNRDPKIGDDVLFESSRNYE